MTDGDMWIQPQGDGYRIGYNFRGTGRFLVLSREQLKQLHSGIEEVLVDELQKDI